MLILLLASKISAQDIRLKTCEDSLILTQADSIKKEYSENGFLLLREASVTMESQFELPVIVSLTKGSYYHFFFIGEYTSRLYEVRMYDWTEKQVAFQQKKWGDVDGNIISYPFIPRFSEHYMIKPVQINKKKKGALCGHFLLFRKKGLEESEQ